MSKSTVFSSRVVAGHASPEISSSHSSPLVERFPLLGVVNIRMVLSL